MVRLRIKALLAAVFLVGTLIVVAYPQIMGGPAFYEVGGAAGRLLRGGAYPWLTVEIDTEVELPQNDINRVINFIGRYTDKSVIYVVTSIIEAEPDFGGEFSPSGFRKVAGEHRNTPEFSFMAMSIHILILSGSYTEGAIGAAWGPTSVVIFVETAPILANIVPIVAHEIGHLMGLNCASGLAQPADQEWYCDGAGHSSQADSLMAPGIDLTSGWVTNLELTPSETDQLEYIKANQ